MAMKNCKECGNEISSKAKKCPNCGADQRNWFMRHKFISGILVLVIIGIIGSLGSEPNNTSSDNSSSSQNEEAEEETVYSVGDVITTDKFEIKVTSVDERSSVGGQYVEASPSEGGTYVTVQWKYKNISDEPIGSFSTPTMNLVDENGSSYSSDVDASGSFAVELDLDRKIISDLNPGISVKDASVFEISKELYQQGEWKLSIDADEDITVKVK